MTYQQFLTCWEQLAEAETIRAAVSLLEKHENLLKNENSRISSSFANLLESTRKRKEELDVSYQSLYKAAKDFTLDELSDVLNKMPSGWQRAKFIELWESL